MLGLLSGFSSGSLVSGPSVSISKTRCWLKSQKEHPKSGYVSQNLHLRVDEMLHHLRRTRPKYPG